MHKRYLIYAVGAALVVLGAACSKNTNTNTATTTNTTINNNTNSPVNYNTNSTVATNTNTSVYVNTNSSATNTNASTNTNTTVSSSGGLTIDNLTTNEQLASPVTVSGKSGASKVYIRVIGNQNVTLFTVPVTVHNGAYTVNLTISVTNTINGKIEAYELDSTGTEVNTVSVPVNFQPKISTTQTNTNATTNTNVTANTNTTTNTNTSSNTNSYYYPY